MALGVLPDLVRQHDGHERSVTEALRTDPYSKPHLMNSSENRSEACVESTEVGSSVENKHGNPTKAL